VQVPDDPLGQTPRRNPLGVQHPGNPGLSRLPLPSGQDDAVLLDLRHDRGRAGANLLRQDASTARRARGAAGRHPIRSCAYGGTAALYSLRSLPLNPSGFASSACRVATRAATGVSTQADCGVATRPGFGSAAARQREGIPGPVSGTVLDEQVASGGEASHRSADRASADAERRSKVYLRQLAAKADPPPQQAQQPVVRGGEAVVVQRRGRQENELRADARTLQAPAGAGLVAVAAHPPLGADDVGFGELSERASNGPLRQAQPVCDPRHRRGATFGAPAKQPDQCGDRNSSGKPLGVLHERGRGFHPAGAPRARR
jgi:hypothetical protein